MSISPFMPVVLAAALALISLGGGLYEYVVDPFPLDLVTCSALVAVVRLGQGA